MMMMMITAHLTCLVRNFELWGICRSNYVEDGRVML